MGSNHRCSSCSRGSTIERETRSQLRQLILANARGDVAGARRLAHRMKGATGTVNARQLAVLLAPLETSLDEGTDDVGALVVAIARSSIAPLVCCATSWPRPEGILAGNSLDCVQMRSGAYRDSH
jgi:HPt (histidine-containing phosphotransfer) domain-containing protein